MKATHGNSQIHIIDHDFRRRAHLSRELLERDIHAEIYESIEEFLQQVPSGGSILMVDDGDKCDVAVFLEKLRSNGEFFAVAGYSDDPQPARIVNALHAGAIDYLSWPIDSEMIASTLKRLSEEREARIRLERERVIARTLVQDLTARESDVLASLVEGNSNKEIAQDLGISHRTVEIYRKNMMVKLNARSTAAAVRIAIYAGVWNGRGVWPAGEAPSSSDAKPSQAARMAADAVSEAA